MGHDADGFCTSGGHSGGDSGTGRAAFFSRMALQNLWRHGREPRASPKALSRIGERVGEWSRRDLLSYGGACSLPVAAE